MPCPESGSYYSRIGDFASLRFQMAINPATIYAVFRASPKRQIKAQLAGNGHSIGKSCNAELTLIRRP